MLKDACRRFRDAFEPGRGDPHRARCPECAAWAELLEATLPAAGEPLPAALRRRLREIPRREVACRDVERLYGATRRRARGGGEADAAAERHLEDCRRCRAVYGALGDALAPKEAPLPLRLARRLAAIARPAPLPEWIRDARYAAAACYLLTAVLLGLAGDASALFRDATGTVGSRAEAWVAAGETRGSALWSAASSTVGRGLDGGRRTLERYSESCGRLLDGAVRWVESRQRELTVHRERSTEGDDDERSRAN